MSEKEELREENDKSLCPFVEDKNPLLYDFTATMKNGDNRNFFVHGDADEKSEEIINLSSKHDKYFLKNKRRKK